MYAKMILAALFLINLSYGLQISEIMYNPEGSDNNHEWIEVYNNDTEPVDMKIVKLRTGETDHALADGMLAPGGYAVISQDNATFLSDYGFNGTCIDSSWASLSNSASEVMVLKNSTFVFDNVTYEPLAEEGMSLCRNSSLFYECSPSPGAENIIEELPVVSNTTCSLSMKIEAPEIYVSVYSIVLNDTSCDEKNVTIEYWIEDLFGAVVKNRFNTTQSVSCSKTVARSWTPEIEGSEGYVIFSRVMSCEINASKVIIVKGTAPSSASSVSITDADSEIKFGESVDVELYVYRGDTNKYAVDVYVQGSEKVSAVSVFHAGSKMKSYEVQMPVQLKPNCNGGYADGVYNIVAEGLDATITRQITVSGISSANCKTITLSSGSSGGGGGFAMPSKSIEVISYPDILYVGEEFDVIVNVKSPSASVYSYVYTGNTPVSEGYAGKWSGSWTANKVDITPGMNHTVALKSRIEDGTKPGLYNLRVKSSSDEITKEVQVKEKPVTVIANSAPAAPNSSVVLAKDVPKLPVTGLVAKKVRNLDDYKGLLAAISIMKFRMNGKHI